MRIVKKKEIKYEKFSLYVTSTSHSRIWGGVLGSIQEMSGKCLRPCTK